MPPTTSFLKSAPLAKSGTLKITQHAAQEMAEEEIALDDVLHAISNACLLEDYPDHRRGACSLLYGTDARPRDIHMICTTANPTLIIITAYLPKPPKWISPTQRRSQS
jgi:Domain of unknown function (DUF4258)